MDAGQIIVVLVVVIASGLGKDLSARDSIYSTRHPALGHSTRFVVDPASCPVLRARGAWA